MGERVVLTPVLELADDWLPASPASLRARRPSPEDSEAERRARTEARRVTIEVAPAADSVFLRGGSRFSYFKVDLGMNMVLPTGRVEEMRFWLQFEDGSGAIVTDGIPNDQVTDNYIVKGRVSVGLDEALRFIPLLASVPMPANMKLGPYDFHLGHLRKVKILFSGPLTNSPNWFFRAEGIKGHVGVSMTLRVPNPIHDLAAHVRAQFSYDPGFLRRSKWSTDQQTVSVLFP